MAGLIFSSLLFLVIFYVLVPWLILPIGLKKTDGWVRLYKSYNSKDSFTGKVWYPFCVAMRGNFGFYFYLHYPFIKIGADKDSLFIGLVLPLSFGREWVAIPWDEITVRKRIARPSNELTFKEATGVSMLTTNRLLRELEQASGKYWPN